MNQVPTLEDLVKTLGDYRAEQGALLDIINRPGWKLICAEFDRAATHAYAEMQRSDNAHVSAKSMGCYHAAANVSRWPEQRLKQLEFLISALSKVKGTK